MNAFQLRRNGFVDKIPEEMPLCHEKDKKDDDLCAFRSNDRFGFNTYYSSVAALSVDTMRARQLFEVRSMN